MSNPHQDTRETKEQGPLGGVSPTAVDVLPCSVHTGQLSHAARDRVIRAGTGWCAFTHQHDNSKAAISAAVEALLLARGRILANLPQDAVCELDTLLAELGSATEASHAKRAPERTGALAQDSDSLNVSDSR